MNNQTKIKGISVRSLGIALLVLLFFFAYSGIVLNPRTVEMKGKLHRGPNPKATLWSMTWVHHQLLSDPINLYRANVYYPHSNSLAYGDSFLAQGLTTLPFWFLTDEPTVLLNTAFWMAFALSGFLMYALAYHLSRNHLIGVIAGIFFAFSPYQLDNIASLQYSSQQWLPLIVLAFILFFLERKTRWLIGAVAGVWLTAMSCGAYMIMAVVPLGLLILLLWTAKPLSGRLLGRLVFAGVILSVLLAPFFPQSWKAHGEAGTEAAESELTEFSPDILDFAKRPKYMVSTPYAMLPEKIKTPYFTLFPGFIASAAIIAALLLFLGEIRLEDPERENLNKGLRAALTTSWLAVVAAALFAAAMIILNLFLPPPEPVTDFNLVSLAFWLLIITFAVNALLSAIAYRRGLISESDLLLRIFISLAVLNATLSLGPDVNLNNIAIGQNVFSLFHQVVPGFSFVRQVLHFNTFTMLFAVPAAAIALKRIETLPQWTYWAVIIVLFGAIAFEYRTDMSRDYVEVPLDVPAMYSWLASEPEASPYIGLPAWPWSHRPEADRIYWSIYHWKPMVNGCLSYPPRDYDLLVRKTADFPSRESIHYIQMNYMLKYIIVETEYYDSRQLTQIEELFSQQWSKYKLKKKWNNFWVFENSAWSDKYFYAVKPPQVDQPGFQP